jgi:RND family efflux transporter MFP subunit
MKKKTLLLLSILLVVLAAGFTAYRAWASASSNAAASVQTIAVERGSVTATLSASGNTRSGQNAVVTWQIAGKVGQVSLQPGDVVEAEQALAELDAASLSTDLIKARQELLDAQQALDDLQNSKLQQAQALEALDSAQENLDNLKRAAAVDSSQAQLALAQAQEAYDDAVQARNYMNYPHSTDALTIEQAETDYLLAKAAYKEALQEYNKYIKKNLTNLERARALNNLVAARDKMETALATYNWYLQGYTANEIAQADADVAVAKAALDSAQAEWERVKDGASQAAILLAEAQLADAQRAWEQVQNGPDAVELAAAQTAVDIAQAAVDKAQLTAPFGGTITEVDVKTGDLVSAGDSAFRIDDLASLYIDLQISEVDLASLKAGQQALIEFDALPDQQYTGEVVEIGMVGSVSQGVVNYTVVVRINDSDGQIRPGMTAAVTLILEQRDGVLMAPNKAIRTSQGVQTVTLLVNGQQMILPVQVGLVGDSTSEVISDQLQEGDLLVTSTSAASTTTQQNIGFGGGIMVAPAGGMPPGGAP